MKKNNPIQLKAAFLLLVFALNTMVGFACAVGVDLGFNSKHHHDEEQAPQDSVHIHADGKKHSHHESQSDSNAQGKAQHQNGVSNHESKNGSDNCCNDQVLKFEQLDKAIAQTYAAVNPVFFTAFINTYYNIDLAGISNRPVSIKFFVRSHHPPIPDIRIAVQSFQI